MSGDQDQGQQEVPGHPMILVKPLGSVAVLFGGLGSDQTDEALDEEPDDDGQSHLAVCGDEVRGVVQVFVVNDRGDAQQEDGEGQGEVDDLVLPERCVLGGRTRRSCGRLQRLDG